MMLQAAAFMSLFSIMTIITLVFVVASQEKGVKENEAQTVIDDIKNTYPTRARADEFKLHPKSLRAQTSKEEVVERIGGRCFFYSREKGISRVECPKTKIIRDFADDDVLCYPEDLKAHHPKCECCGGWIESDYGMKCNLEISFDCTEEYKLTHYRRAGFSWK